MFPVLAPSIVQSALLTQIQQRSDAPFGLLFLRVCAVSLPAPLCGQLTTQSNDETSNDGSSRLDPVYDEDEEDDEEAADVL